MLHEWMLSCIGCEACTQDIKHDSEHLTCSVRRWVGGIRSLSAQGLMDWVVHVTAIHQLLPKEAQQAISMHSCVAEANSTGAGHLERSQIEHM